jgi:hypothetical protein
MSNGNGGLANLKPFTADNPRPGPGRPLNSRNKLGHAFVRALQEEFDQHGPETIRICRVEDPVRFLEIISRVIPAELEVAHAVVVHWLPDDGFEPVDCPAVQKYE